MKHFMKAILGIALGLAVAVNVSAQTNLNANVASTNQTQATAQNDASNAGVTNTFNSTSPAETKTHVEYSGVTGSNTSVGLGSFSSSFSSDYCGGTQQAAASIPYLTAAIGGPVLKEPGVACVNTRAAVHTMEFSSTYGNASVKALDLANEAEKRKDEDAAKQYRVAAQMYSEQSGKLAQAATYMLCNLSDDVRQAYRDAGIMCPQTKQEKADAEKQAQQEAQHQAIASNQPVDPFVRERMGLPTLASK